MTDCLRCHNFCLTVLHFNIIFNDINNLKIVLIIETKCRISFKYLLMGFEFIHCFLPRVQQDSSGKVSLL